MPQDEGVYVGLRYVDGEGADALTWKIDLWFFPEYAPRPEFPLRDRLRHASALEREAILLFKYATVADGSYGRNVRGVDIYTAVLDGGVRSIEDWQRSRRQPRSVADDLPAGNVVPERANEEDIAGIVPW